MPILNRITHDWSIAEALKIFWNIIKVVSCESCQLFLVVIISILQENVCHKFVPCLLLAGPYSYETIFSGDCCEILRDYLKQPICSILADERIPSLHIVSIGETNCNRGKFTVILLDVFLYLAWFHLHEGIDVNDLLCAWDKSLSFRTLNALIVITSMTTEKALAPLLQITLATRIAYNNAW